MDSQARTRPCSARQTNNLAVPFLCPDITEQDCAAVVQVLKSGWITTGPVVQQFEQALAHFSHCPAVICMASATAALELALRAFGVGPGDEVITSVYTYAATANAIIHVGAKPVFVDVAENSFNTSAEQIAAAITKKTKAVIPVDVGGLPCDYKAIRCALKAKKSLFCAQNPYQEHMGRPLLLADAAHSLGARAGAVPSASQADMTAYSFHAVKNLTTAEGGALCLGPIWKEYQQELTQLIRLNCLHGQSKDALTKQKIGSWQYDILFPGYKCNMTDLHAALGLSQLGRYSHTLQRRAQLCAQYSKKLQQYPRAIVPVFQNNNQKSSYHLYMLRMAGCTEQHRDAAIAQAAQEGIALNVHFQPLPLLTAYKNLGYRMADYRRAYQYYAQEITLPLYPQLTDAQLEAVVRALQKYLR